MLLESSKTVKTEVYVAVLRLEMYNNLQISNRLLHLIILQKKKLVVAEESSLRMQMKTIE